jgi:hypothetical protein
MLSAKTLIFTQSVYASVAHRYWNATWSPEKNREVYAQDASEEGLGSNLQLEARVLAPVTFAEARLNRPLAQLKDVIDHQSLFAAGAAFTDRASTLENITHYLSEALFQQPLEGATWESLTVHESDRLACTVSPEACELRVKCANLVLTCRGPLDPKSGLLIDRGEIPAVVQALLQENGAPVEAGPWSLWLFRRLKSAVQSLHSLRIDTSRGEYIVVHSDS